MFVTHSRRETDLVNVGVKDGVGMGSEGSRMNRKTRVVSGVKVVLRWKLRSQCYSSEGT